MAYIVLYTSFNFLIIGSHFPTQKKISRKPFIKCYAINYIILNFPPKHEKKMHSEENSCDVYECLHNKMEELEQVMNLCYLLHYGKIMTRVQS